MGSLRCGWAIVALGAFVAPGCIDRTGAMGYHELAVSSVPDGALVTQGGRAIGNTPVLCILERDEWHHLRVELAGHHPVDVAIGPESRPAHGPRVVTSAVPLAALGQPGSQLLAVTGILTLPFDAAAYAVTEGVVGLKSLDVAPMPASVSLDLEPVGADEKPELRRWVDVERHARKARGHAGVDRPALTAAEKREAKKKPKPSVSQSPAPSRAATSAVKQAAPSPQSTAGTGVSRARDKPLRPVQEEVGAPAGSDTAELGITDPAPKRKP